MFPPNKNPSLPLLHCRWDKKADCVPKPFGGLQLLSTSEKTNSLVPEPTGSVWADRACIPEWRCNFRGPPR